MATGDPEHDGWERSDFPIVCETCLGDNPYVRMTRNEYGKECKVCTRPFTVFRWRAGTRGRFKKTEICQTCSKLKNVCQTCLLDLNFNLPVQVRDSALPTGSLDQIPQSDVNLNYFAAIADERVKKGYLPFANAQYNPVLEGMARREPVYDRNRAQICSFFVKGNCSRGDACPYRHEMPNHKEGMAKQNIRDRYYGRNDPVAMSMLNKNKDEPLVPPEDRDITTLWIGNVNNTINENMIHSFMYQYGQVRNVKILREKTCAFVDFVTRTSAEAAAEKLTRNFAINGVYLKLDWGRGSKKSQPNKIQAPAPKISNPLEDSYYPSMDPNRLGSAPTPVNSAPAFTAAPPVDSESDSEEDENSSKKRKLEDNDDAIPPKKVKV
eukprot:TRINITY_DN868_c0_g1_i3.p1 TRINITY_DN868_c0_g1~~TRINITY_DN868_c0_g1_i3.p1  ORF type:complete len:392 (+),score=86.87 TRINITY_DN868_c0_g1_i3:37-1176(+)